MCRKRLSLVSFPREDPRWVRTFPAGDRKPFISTIFVLNINASGFRIHSKKRGELGVYEKFKSETPQKAEKNRVLQDKLARTCPDGRGRFEIREGDWLEKDVMKAGCRQPRQEAPDRFAGGRLFLAPPWRWFRQKKPFPFLRLQFMPGVLWRRRPRPPP